MAESSTKTLHSNLIGGATFSSATNEIERPGHPLTRLRPQTSQVLEILIANAGNTISKDELIEMVWRDTHVTDDSLVQCISEIRKALGPSDAKLLRTISGKGYRLETTDRPEEVKPTHRRIQVIAGFVVLCCIVLAFFMWPRQSLQTAPQTIAVLPFTNMSGSDDQAYFSDGVTEDLIIGLSKISDLRVISRGASFAVARDTDNILELAKTLNVQYILEGSVRRHSGTLRVSAALVDGTTGANLWAERYEGAEEEIFTFQEKLLTDLLRSLSVRLSENERTRLGIFGTQDVNAHDAYLRGVSLEHRFTSETNLTAEIALKEAIRIDPNFAAAHAHLAQVYSYRVENRWTEWPEETADAAFAAANRALALDDTLPYAYFSLGRLYSRSFAPDGDKSITAFNRAISLDPNYVDARVFLANVLIFNGRANEALPLIAEAMERHPLPPFWYFQAEGMAQYFLGSFEEAEAALIQARDQNPTAPYPYRFLMATYGQLGQLDEAEWMAMEYEALGRQANISALMETASIQDDVYRQIFLQGFELAGIPSE